jgi:hypothetical protein
LKLFEAVVCGLNQVYELRAECPKTCVNPSGNYDCGLIKPVEGCYCQNGYVLNGEGVCIKLEECGCLLPDNSGILSVKLINKK